MVVLSILFSFSFIQTKLANIVTYRINDSFGTSISIDKVDLSSLRNIKLKKVLIKDHHLDTLFYVGNLQTSILNYKSLFKSNLEFGDILIENAKFFMKTYKDEERNSLTIFANKFNKESKSNENHFQMSSSSIQLKDVDFNIIDLNKKETPIVFYDDIYGFFDDFSIYDSNVSATIHNLKTIEDHKVNIVNFKTKFSYSNTKMKFLQTELYTEKSNLNADIVFNYKAGDLSDFTNKVQISADIIEANIVLSDLKKFYGEFGKNDQIHFSTKVTGTLNDFVLEEFDLESDRNSSLRGTIYLKDILHSNKFQMVAELEEISSSYDHLVNLLPNLLGNKIPPSLEKIGYFSSNGRVKVTKTSLNVKLKTIAEIGISDVDMNITKINQINEASYTGKIELLDFKLGNFVKDSLLGKFSMIGEVDGKGFSIDNISLKVKGNISKHQYKGYTYSNIDINGILKDKHFNGELKVNDPNIRLVFKGLADLSNDDYVFNFNADVDHADFYKLNLFKRDEKSILKGKIDINLKGSNLDNIEGEISFFNASYYNQNDNYYFKDFNIVSIIKDSIREVYVNSTDIINGSIKGNFQFRQLKTLAKNSFGSLFDNYKKEEVKKGQFLDFNFNIYNKIVDVFYPKLKLGANTIIRGELNSDNDKFKLTLKSPKVEAFDFLVDNIKLQIDNKNPIYNTILSVDNIDTKYYNVADVNMVNVVLNDTLFIRTDFIGGKELKEKYNFSFYHTINENNQSVFGIKKSDIIFKNNTWYINANNNNQNKIVFDKSYKMYAIDNINMTSGNQHINLAGAVNGSNNRNIDLILENVNLFDVMPSIDSVTVNGKINGTLNLKTVNNKTLPFADISVNYFSINDDYYGDLFVKASSDETIKNYSFEATLLNSGLKSFFTKGAIDLNSNEPMIIASVEFDKFKINAFSPLGKNVLSKIRGYASGKATITGVLANPYIDGEIELKESGLELPYLNVNYNFLGDSKVKLYNHTFDFQHFKIEDDVMRTTGVMNGTITHKEFKKWKLDLELRTDNLLVLNTEESEDALYYGTGLLSGSTTLRGFTDELVIDVNGRTNPGTEFILPLSDVSTVSDFKLIHFENTLKTEDDKSNKDEIVFERLKGLTINFKLDVTKDAVAQIVVDKESGSVLRGSGDGDLTLNIDTNGKFEMHGALVIDNGEYQFKNIVNKDFEVQKGGTIIWNGNPYDADINIVAINYTKANPSVLLDEIASTRKIDVELITKLSGKLSAPNLDFDIQIPNSSSLVTSELEFKLRNEDDKLTQFFSLLATGSFARIDQNKSNFNSNAAIAGTIAQKATQLLSNVLESENDNFEVGVTYDIGSNNDVNDVITDDQLGIEVSGRIADKVIVSGKVGVPVGSSTNSNVIGEVEVKVPLNSAETLQAKVYNRQNEIQFDVVEGEGYTQGVGISYRFDFENANEFAEKIGLKRTEEEKLLSKDQRDSIKRRKKIIRKESKLKE